jgi:6-pyruvoyltetrahydropterin/6-carboxytetrahydropterin synthase
MKYRVCKSFHVESGHMLSKHPGLCQYPHGHSRRVDVVLASDALDSSEMVCDFKALKLAVKSYIDRLDHAMAINSQDKSLPSLQASNQRLVIYPNLDPTTEVMAKDIFDHLASELTQNKTYRDEQGTTYRFPKGLTLERVRVTETATTWAEYGIS